MTPSSQTLAHAIRLLSVDAVQAAKSGHPGMPMGMADIATVLWRDFLRHNPANPTWLNRDRFVLSNGHGSMLLYALLHLTGYDLSLDELKNFRQWQSKTPGHPEWGITPGVETTTGPLGQGLANAVGMAVSERHLASLFNRPHFPVFDHFTYVFAGDGCLMEGVSHEACSLAGTLRLNKLIVFWDDNGISIDGPVEGWFSEDVGQRFAAYGWQVIAVDGHDQKAIKQAILEAQEDTCRPTLIACKTTIGFGSPSKAGTADSHGAPLGDEEIAAVRDALQWPHPAFEVPEAIRQAWDCREKGASQQAKWDELHHIYAQAHPELAKELNRRVQGELPTGWAKQTQEFIRQQQSAMEHRATRQSSQRCLIAYTEWLPELVGGSADLTGSNGTAWPEADVFTAKDPRGRYLHYGVREFAMSAIMNGMALDGLIIPFGGTFLTFSDYARNAVRMAALMQQRVIFVYTHDSIGLGEDGPTHQPIEHLSSLRLIPGLSVWRPADTVETAVAWKLAIERKGPTCLALTRQKVTTQQRNKYTVSQIARGGYILEDCEGKPDLIILATGSELELGYGAWQQLSQTFAVRLVSMPSVDVFLQQSASYRQSVLPAGVTKRVAIEAGTTGLWYQLVGLKGRVFGIDSFGESAPAAQVYAHFGLTVEQIVTEIQAYLGK